MRNVILLTLITLLLGAFGSSACSKSPSDKNGTASLTGGSVNAAAPSPDEIRMALMQAKPNEPSVSALSITDEGGVVTLRGTVPDEPTHIDILDRVKSMSNVTGVRDQLQVALSQPSQPQPQTPEPSGGSGMNMGKATPTSDAVRAMMNHEEPQAAMIIQHLTITDDGTSIWIRGVVPDADTHDALLRSAKRSAGGENVNDQMQVGGK